MTVTDGSRFPVLTPGNYFYATIITPSGIFEIVKVTTRTGNAMSIVRGQDGTNAQEFPANSRVEMRINAASIKEVVSDQNTPLEARLTTAENDITTIEADIVALEAFDTTLGTSAGSNSVGFLQSGTGATARTVQGKLRDVVSVKDFGAVGDGSTDDTTKIQAALTHAGIQKCAVYVPATANGYKITAALTMATNTTLFGDGYGSLINQVTADLNAINAVSMCSVRNLRVKVADGTNTAFCVCISAVSANNVTIENNYLEPGDLGGCGVYISGVQQSTIRNNRIYGGKWSSGAGYAASASDILLYSFSASERHIIEGNYCLSNNSQGIFVDALGYDGDIIISNNICVTLDPATCVPAGAWSLIATGGVRRHGIMVGYNSTLVDGPRTVVSGNLCRNTRWTGIYFQGANKGCICSNNVCSLNGYETTNTLSGGIYFVQNGYELINGNLILDFQNTQASTGGITVNATTTATTPSKISGNTIRGSLGQGIALGTNTALCEVSDNLLIGNVGNDIYSVVSDNVGNGGHYIARNNIYRTSGNNVSAITINPAASSSLVTRVIGNKIRGFDNATSSTSNVGIQCVRSVSLYDIKDNIVENFYHGLYFASYQTTNRSALIEGNTFVDCSIGISMGATTGNVTVPVVDNDFVNMLVSETAAALGGAAAARICTREATRLAAQTYSAAPANGDWIIGDRAMFTAPVAGGYIGAVCVTAGTPGTWKSYGAIAL
jgi:parallel beta-helix repeat protein